MLKKYAVSKGRTTKTKIATGGGIGHMLAGSCHGHYSGCSLQPAYTSRLQQ